MTIPWQAPNSTKRGILQPGREDVLAHDTQGQGLDQGVFDWVAFYEGQPLENWFQHYIAAVANVEASLVRPRWQQTPPNLPEIGTTWISTGIARKKPIAGGQWGAVVHVCDNAKGGPGHDVMLRHEDIELAITIYGPGCEEVADNLHSGLMIWQNRVILRLVGMALVEVGEGVRVPELVKMQWLDRIDKTIFFRRIIIRNYPVNNLAQGPLATLHTP